MLQNELTLTDLVNLEHWQKVQDLLGDTLEITLRTVSPDGRVISKTSHPSRICDLISSKKSEDLSFCGVCGLREITGKLSEIKEIKDAKCPFDLDVFVVPIKAAGDKIFCHIIAGPVSFKNRKNIEEYANEAKELGVNMEILNDALIDVNIFTYNKIHSINQLLQYMFSNAVQSAYHKKRLAEIKSEVLSQDPLFERYYEEKVLGALLKSCTKILDADCGSVMTLDKNTNTLNIKVSTKIEDSIKNSTHVKVGEGIAGIAAATSQPIILPKDGNNAALHDKLKRNYIKSSMIIPFEKGGGHEVYGVLNLNIMRKEKDFTEKDIAVVQELASLASIALGLLQTK